MRPVERLAHIDIAEARHDALVQQQGLDRLAAPLQGLGQHGGVEVRPQGLGAHALEPGVLVQMGRGHQAHETEAAGVVVGDAPPRVGVEHHMGVLVPGRDGVGEHAGGDRARKIFNFKTSGHAQMHHQGLAGGELGQQIFGPAAQMLDPGAGQALHEMVGQGKPQVRPPRQDVGDRMPLERGEQAPADRFDFGKLRHGGSARRSWPRA